MYQRLTDFKGEFAYLKIIVYTLSSLRNTRHTVRNCNLLLTCCNCNLIRNCNLLFTCCCRHMQGACVKGLVASGVAVLFILGGWFTVVQQKMRVAIKVVRFQL